MEERRNKLREERENCIIDTLEKNTNRKGRRSGSMMDKKILWPDVEVTNFFLPGGSSHYPWETIG